MIQPEPSTKVRQLVGYIESVGFHLETDELLDRGILDVLTKEYEINSPLTFEELKQIEDELLSMAKWNEIREARYQLWVAQPEDRGTMIFRQGSQGGMDNVSSYPMPYSYPVDENLLSIRRGRKPWERFRKDRSPVSKGHKSKDSVASAGTAPEALRLKALLKAASHDREGRKAHAAGVSE